MAADPTLKKTEWSKNISELVFRGQKCQALIILGIDRTELNAEYRRYLGSSISPHLEMSVAVSNINE